MKPQKVNNIIYIQLFENDVDLREHHEVTWCNEKINESDIQYIRGDNLKEYSDNKLRALKSKLIKDGEFVVFVSDPDKFYINWNNLKGFIEELMENKNAKP